MYEYGAKSLSASAHHRADVRDPLGGIRKRAFDITFTSLALIVLAPILLAAAILIRLLIRKSVLVTDESIGFGGKAFARYQFASAVHQRVDTNSALLRLIDPFWAERLLPEYLLARPGITGVWRRTRRTRRTSWIALDRYYVRYWSLSLDLALLLEAIAPTRCP